MNRRNFLSDIIQAGVACMALPAAVTYERLWKRTPDNVWVIEWYELPPPDPSMLEIFREIEGVIHRAHLRFAIPDDIVKMAEPANPIIVRVQSRPMDDVERAAISEVFREQ